MATTDWQGLIFLIIGWTAYFGIHSILASSQVKEWVSTNMPILKPWYRLGFNAVALGGFMLLLGYQQTIPTAALWDGSGWSQVVGAATIAVAALLAWRAMRYYDLGSFVGWRQQESRTIDPPEALATEGLNAHVRHPLYTATVLLLIGWIFWSPSLVTLIVVALAGIYLRIGIYFEEIKLVNTYGAAYERYQQEVPMLFPRLSRDGKKGMRNR